MVMDCVDDGNGEKDITNSQIILFVEGIFLGSTMVNPGKSPFGEYAFFQSPSANLRHGLTKIHNLFLLCNLEGLSAALHFLLGDVFI